MTRIQTQQQTSAPKSVQSSSILSAQSLNVRFGKDQILEDINLSVPAHQITCLIGPSGSGKSTLIRCFNRMNDEVDGFDYDGDIQFQGKSVNHSEIEVSHLRTQIGMVFQKPCVFPTSIRKNVLFGVSHHKNLTDTEKKEIVQTFLKAVSLWDEVKGRLSAPAQQLSAGQQQRLSIARTLAVQPEVILLDEPTSSLDPSASRAIEDLMLSLKEDYSLLFVTHNIQQAQRIADHLIFLCNGRVIESGPKEQLFQNPQEPQTHNYLHDEYCEC